jgi:hypothetical protein
LNDVPEWRPTVGYASSQACRKCHPEQFDTYLQTAHSRALVAVDSGNEPPGTVFDNAASGRRYRVVHRDGRLIHEEALLLDDGTEFPLKSVPVPYRIGSGHFARTYLGDEGGGFLVESPVTWYEPAHVWGMTPGFDRPGHASFTRQIPESCLWCHVGQYQMSTSSNFRFRLVENSIGCERCHGPGEKHIQEQTARPNADGEVGRLIVNPRRLSRKLSEAVCQQCHLQGDIRIAGRGSGHSNIGPGSRSNDSRRPIDCDERRRG